jgi:hypothetical protein
MALPAPAVEAGLDVYVLVPRNRSSGAVLDGEEQSARAPSLAEKVG